MLKLKNRKSKNTRIEETVPKICFLQLQILISNTPIINLILIITTKSKHYLLIETNNIPRISIILGTIMECRDNPLLQLLFD